MTYPSEVYMAARDISDEDDSGYMNIVLFHSLESAKGYVEEVHRCKDNCGWVEIKGSWFCFIGRNPRAARAVEDYVVRMTVHP
jgi:hypothetical protein